jgi:5-methylcytosine-specific restriction endonuclease McrA
VLSYDKPTLYSGLSVNRMIADINKLDQKARRAGFRSYSAYLRSRHWRRLRKRVLKRDGHACQRCGTSTDLTVHHRRYDIGHDRLEDLVTLCESCHDGLHGHRKVDSLYMLY